MSGEGYLNVERVKALTLLTLLSSLGAQMPRCRRRVDLLLPTVEPNRLFIFLIRDNVTNSILFIGQVLDPSAWLES